MANYVNNNYRPRYNTYPCNTMGIECDLITLNIYYTQPKCKLRLLCNAKPCILGSYILFHRSDKWLMQDILTNVRSNARLNVQGDFFFCLLFYK